MDSQKPYNEGRQTQWRKEKGQTTIYTQLSNFVSGSQLPLPQLFDPSPICV
jgi:hypothetical protein